MYCIGDLAYDSTVAARTFVVGFAARGFHFRHVGFCWVDFSHSTFILEDMTVMPNKSPEPTAFTAAVAIHVASRRWLSFFR